MNAKLIKTKDFQNNIESRYTAEDIAARLSRPTRPEYEAQPEDAAQFESFNLFLFGTEKLRHVHPGFPDCLPADLWRGQYDTEGKLIYSEIFGIRLVTTHTEGGGMWIPYTNIAAADKLKKHVDRWWYIVGQFPSHKDYGRVTAFWTLDIMEKLVDLMAKPTDKNNQIAAPPECWHNNWIPPIAKDI